MESLQSIGPWVRSRPSIYIMEAMVFAVDRARQRAVGEEDIIITGLWQK